MVDPKHTSKLHINYLKTTESQLSWMFLHSHLTSTQLNIYGVISGLRKSSIL